MAEHRIVGLGTQGFQSVQIASPTDSDTGIEQRGQPRIGLLQPAPWRDAVGDVVEALGKQSGVIGEDGIDHQLRMQGRNAVHPVRCDYRQRRHTHMADAAFIDQGDTFGQLLVVRETCAHIGQKPVVDVVDDFQMARQ